MGELEGIYCSHRVRTYFLGGVKGQIGAGEEAKGTPKKPLVD